MHRIELALAVAAVLLLLAPTMGGVAVAAEGTPDTNTVRIITIDGAIGPATRDYVRNQLDAAAAANAELVLLRIDTPGGLSRSTYAIVQAIMASPVPVAGYVAPRGARAASAGTYILYATHIAAMAPATHLGAATPVVIGGAPQPSDEPQQAPAQDDNSGADSNASAQQSGSVASNQAALRRKRINDAVAFIRSLARQRQRNADWAEAAVRDAATATAQQALHNNVIDLMASSRAQLLSRIDGMSVRTAAGPVTLHTESIRIVTTEPSWQTRLLSLITRPTVAYVLLMVGIFGLLFEALSPGAVLPGVVGAICLMAALYAFQIIPVNLAGLGLIALGVALMVAELFAPSFGVLGLGGVAALAFGSVMLMHTGVPGFETPLGLILGLAISAALLMLLVITLFMGARRKRVHTGQQGLIGRHCHAMEDFDGNGRVWLHGEAWHAWCDTPVHRNDTLVVIAAQGLQVRVRPAGPPTRASSES